MAKGNFPRFHTKTLVFSFLVLLVPLFILIASSTKLQETRSNAYHDSGGGGGAVFPGPKNPSAKLVKCISATEATVEFSWDNVPGAYGYVFDWTDRNGSFGGSKGVANFNNKRTYIQNKVQVYQGHVLNRTKFYWSVNAAIQDSKGIWHDTGKSSGENTFVLTCDNSRT